MENEKLEINKKKYFDIDFLNMKNKAIKGKESIIKDNYKINNGVLLMLNDIFYLVNENK